MPPLQNRLRPAVWSAALALWLAPLVAMQFTDHVAWTGLDFALFGALLAAALGGYELAARNSGDRAARAGFAIALVTAFLLIWAHLAVGVVGDGGTAGNFMVGGILAIGLAGSLAAGFRSSGMAFAMAGAATAQALVGVIAAICDLDDILVPTAGFVSLWLVAASLFRAAARRESAARA